MIIFLKKEKKESRKYIFLPLLSILLSMVLVGESWWARYIPQFYLIPIGCLALLVYLMKYIEKKYLLNIAKYLFLIVILLNTRILVSAKKENLKDFKQITRDIEYMKQIKDLEIKLGAEHLYGYLYTLNDNNVSYTLVEDIPIENQRFKYSWRIVVNEREELSKIN